MPPFRKGYRCGCLYIEVVGLRHLDWHDLRPGEDAEALVRGLVVAGDEIGTLSRMGGMGCPIGLNCQDSNRVRLARLNSAIITPDVVLWAREGYNSSCSVDLASQENPSVGEQISQDNGESFGVLVQH